MGPARLEVVAGNAAGMSILVEDELLIGRHAVGAGRLAEDEEISRSHARVTLDASGFCAIEDLGSTNGTFVNGLRISAPQTLSEGDTIEIGATTLVVRSLPRAEGAPAAPGNQSTTAADTPAPPLAPEPPPPDPTPEPEPPLETTPEPEPPLETTPERAREPAPAVRTLRVMIDFTSREVRLSSDDTPEPLRLVIDEGAWRPDPSPPD